MKTLFKIFIWLVVIIFVLLVFVFATLNSQSMLDKVTSVAIEQSGLDIKYSSLRGNLFDGLKLKGFNYEDKIKADLNFKADFGKLKSGVVHIKELELTELFIDENFLKTLSSTEKKQEKKSDSKSAIKMLIVDSAKLNLVDFKYQDYHVQKLDIDLKNIKYDMDKDIQADIKADILSSLIDAKLNMSIKNEKYKLHLEGDPKAKFLNSFASEHNISIQNPPHVVIDGDGDFEEVNAHVFLDSGNLKYQDILVDIKSIDLTTIHNIKNGDNKSDLKALIDSNVAKIDLKSNLKVNINDINNTLNFDLTTNISPKKDYLDIDKLTINKIPKLKIQAKGNFDNIDAKIITDEGVFVYDNINLRSTQTNINADYSLKSGDLKADIKALINSDIADFDLMGDTSLNLNDINNTLKVDFVSHVNPRDKGYFKTTLDENNISVKKMPKFILKIKGDFKKLNLLADVGEGDIKYNNYHIKPKVMNIDANYSMKLGDLGVYADIYIKSNIADIKLLSDITLNSKDINNTLKFKTDAKIIATPKELKDFNVSITKETLITLKASGNMTNITSILDAHGELKYDEIKIKPKIYNTKVDFSPKTKDLKTVLYADIFSDIAKLKIKANVSVNIDDINNTLKYDANLDLTDTKPYKGIDLKSLGDIKVSAKGSLKTLRAHVLSNKLKLIAKSDDFNKFDINLDTKKIDIGKIYRYLPIDLQKSFVNVKSEGFYKLSNKEAKFHTKLRGFKYAHRVIKTDEFDFYMKGDDITLSNFVLKANGFDMTINAKKAGNIIRAKIDNDALKFDADIKLKPLIVTAKARIDSIKKLVAELNKVYPIEFPINMDGALNLDANMQGKDVKIAVTSKKIRFDDGNLENLNISSLYNKDRVLIKNFDFELNDFKPKEFNRKVKLKQDGLIVLTKNKVSVDIELENLLKFKAKQDGDILQGDLDINKLALAYKGYGYTKLTSKLKMEQDGKKLSVTGFVEFKDTDITYESPYLDVSKDQDIIIITREDKGKKKENAFKKYTFLDIDVRSKNEIIYKVKAGEVEMKPNLNIYKNLNEDPKITGKLKILDGFYDVAGKRFLLQEGAVSFRGDEKINPLLDLKVHYEDVDDILIIITIAGDKNRPKLQFSSEPAMSKKDILSALLFGFVVSESEGAASSANKAAENIFGRAVAQDLARELNLDRLDLGRNDIGGIDIKAGKKIKRKSIIYYKNKLNESSVIYEKKLDKKWSIETEVGKQGYGVDLFYRKGYK